MWHAPAASRAEIGGAMCMQVDTQGNTQRVATVLMFLSEVEEGGETVFPLKSTWADPEVKKASASFSAVRQGSLCLAAYNPLTAARAVRQAGAGHQAAHRRCHPVLGHVARGQGGREQHARLLPRHQGREVDRHQMVRPAASSLPCRR